MKNKQIISMCGVAMLSLTSIAMAQPSLQFGGFLNENLYVSSGSVDPQFTLTTAPSITITGGGTKGGVESGTVISSTTTNQMRLWIGGTWAPTTTTLTYTAVVGKHPAISGSIPITIDANGNITNSVSSTTTWSSDGNAACETILTQPSAKNGDSDPTFTLDCGDVFTKK